ncbi:hypothetical protein D3C80_2054660 [compost metagenome]
MKSAAISDFLECHVSATLALADQNAIGMIEPLLTNDCGNTTLCIKCPVKT